MSKRKLTTDEVAADILRFVDIETMLMMMS